MKKKAIMILAMSILVLPMIMVRLPIGEPLPIPAEAEDVEPDPGKFRCGNVELRMGQKSSWLDTWPTLKSTVEVQERIKGGGAEGYTDGTGKVTLQIFIRCKDRSWLFNGYFDVKVRVYEDAGGPLVGDAWWAWVSTGSKETKEVFLDIATDELDEGETEDYYVEIETYVAGTLLNLVVDDEWWDEDWGYVDVISRDHPPLQQYVTIDHPGPSDIYTIGYEYGHVTGYVRTVPDGDAVSDTRVCIVLATERGYGSQVHYIRTQINGFIWLEYCIDDSLANGTLTISVYDDAKNEEYTMDPDGATREIEVEHGTSTFGLFAVPHSSVAPEDLVGYTVGVVPINFEGEVTLDASDLPEGTSYAFDPPIVYPVDVTVVSDLVIFTTDVTPLGLHQFTISATDGVLTRDFTCPLMVQEEPPGLHVDPPTPQHLVSEYLAIAGTDFTAYSVVNVTFDGELMGIWDTDNDGSFSGWLIVPSVPNGNYFLHAVDLERKCGYAILIVMRPDVNCDGVVDILDAAKISAHWYSPPLFGLLGYARKCDIKYDEYIDIFDVAKLNYHWRDEYPPCPDP